MSLRSYVRMSNRGFCLGAGLLLAACGGKDAEPFEPVAGDPAAGLYWALTLDHEVATLSTVAPYNTLQLAATPRDANGNPLEGLGPVAYRSVAPGVAAVDATGLVTATASGQLVQVIAELVAGATRHADTVYINVTTEAAPPVLAQFSIQPPDSATWAVGGDGAFFFINNEGGGVPLGLKSYLPTALDVGDQQVPGVLASYHVSDPAVLEPATFGPSSFVTLISRKPGRVSLYGTTTMYGVTLADTVEFTVTMPTFALVRVQTDPSDPGKLVFAPADVSVMPGGTIIWTNVTGQPVDIAFDDPADLVEHGPVSCDKAGVLDPGGVGDIPAFGEPQDPAAGLSVENCRSRRLLSPGVHTYHSPLTGATGRIVVETGIPAD